MRIAGRANKPWEALFVFHLFCSQGHQAGVQLLEKLMSRELSNGLDFEMTMTAGKQGAPSRISGRFLRPNDCQHLLEAWNEPDGDTPFMCYVPNHGIATVSDGVLDWWALICFQCSNGGVGGPFAISEDAPPNRLLRADPSLQDALLDLLPERPFPLQI